MSDGSCCHYCKRYRCVCEGSPEANPWDKKEETEKRVPLNPFYEWIGAQQRWLQENREQLHPAVFHAAMRMLPGVAELHATDKPELCPDNEGGLYFSWGWEESPLYGMEIYLYPPVQPAEEYEQYNPWKVGQAPVHPPGVWNGAP